MKVPRGKVSTYGAIAQAAGLPRGARLVVRVLSQSHGLPWHQRFRLEMEGVKFSGRNVRMAEFEFKFPKKTKTRKAKPRSR